MESPGSHASLYPDLQHRDAADRVLLYLKQHRALGLQSGVLVWIDRSRQKKALKLKQ